MEIKISLKGKRDFLKFSGDRIDILDFEMNGTKYKQIRIFKKGFSKSEYIDDELINWIKEVK
ncbi:hypothetical protein K5V21_09240 [Clostridium sardiniense]|uniref:Uncharacterized protein n=1 Tax=Clostridium sardiniense TaxID=29369 RepID=A0ABS7KY14_CLOSR|nr:hypothetical protein [Clostridium sardiniense]MBY0755644.1 hypothetical protein [Clostridium sardiniense]MDQ0461814.1 hypothetical protein [Clostridium sardiniense]